MKHADEVSVLYLQTNVLKSLYFNLEFIYAFEKIRFLQSTNQTQSNKKVAKKKPTKQTRRDTRYVLTTYLLLRLD